MKDKEVQRNAYQRARMRTAEVLYFGNKNDPLTRIIDIALIILITLNVIAVVLESVSSIHRSLEAPFYYFEFFSVVVFSVEYLARVWSAVDNPWHLDHAHPVRGRLRYMITWFALIDLLAIAPFYLSMFIGADLRILRALRLLRIFKLTRYSSAMTLLLMVFREESRTISAAMFISMLLMFMGASLAYIFENQAQPEHFSSIPAAIYWAVITMTTVGYGDIVPITPYGRIVGALIGLVGLGMVALPAGILASGFNNALHRRRIMLEEHVQDAMKDGEISDVEREKLNHLVHRLNLNDVDARAIIFAARHRYETSNQSECPHCGKPLHETKPED